MRRRQWRRRKRKGEEEEEEEDEEEEEEEEEEENDMKKTPNESISPGVSMRLILCSFQKKLMEAELIVIPLSRSCTKSKTLQSILIITTMLLTCFMKSITVSPSSTSVEARNFVISLQQH